MDSERGLCAVFEGSVFGRDYLQESLRQAHGEKTECVPSKLPEALGPNPAPVNVLGQPQSLFLHSQLCLSTGAGHQHVTIGFLLVEAVAIFFFF